MATRKITAEQGEITLQEPHFVHTLFNTTRLAWLFVLVRVYLGWDWMTHGWDKVLDPKWTTTGESLLGYWTRAVAIPETGRPPISYDWYRSFIQFLIDTESHTWFAKLVAYGELLVGIGLIVGAFVGITAFFGALMNFNFMLAGSASTNPVLFVIAVFLILGWKVAGYYGLDHYLLPYLGVPWQRNATKAPVLVGGAAD